MRFDNLLCACTLFSRTEFNCSGVLPIDWLLLLDFPVCFDTSVDDCIFVFLGGFISTFELVVLGIGVKAMRPS